MNQNGKRNGSPPGRGAAGLSAVFNFRGKGNNGKERPELTESEDTCTVSVQVMKLRGTE